jgi:lysophospholipase L1-like esterase
VIRRLLAVLLWTAILAGCSAAAPTPVAPPTPLPPQPACGAPPGTRGVCILVLGDSIADGVPLTGEDRWWVRLRSLLAEALPDRQIVVDSWAVPGSRVNVLASAAHDQPALDSYDLAIVIEGVNDAAWTPLDTWRAGYEAAIATIEQRGLTVVVGTPPPSFEDGAFATRYDPVAEALRGIAGDRRPLLDIAARWHADGASTAAGYYSDLIHQGAEGQRLMADLARDVVLPLLQGASSG